jgi:hypothetical protein
VPDATVWMKESLWSRWYLHHGATNDLQLPSNDAPCDSSAQERRNCPELRSLPWPGSRRMRPEPAPRSCQRPATVQPLYFSARQYPHIRDQAVSAAADGWPRTLVVNRRGVDGRRSRLFEGMTPRRRFDGSEYPPAVGRGRANRGYRGLVRGTNPIGWMADVRFVPSREHRLFLSALDARLAGLCDGTRFRYVFRKRSRLGPALAAVPQQRSYGLPPTGARARPANPAHELGADDAPARAAGLPVRRVD